LLVKLLAVETLRQNLSSSPRLTSAISPGHPPPTCVDGLVYGVAKCEVVFSALYVCRLLCADTCRPSQLLDDKLCFVEQGLFYFYFGTVGASSRVFQILFGKFCVLPTPKKICQVNKIVHLQQFDIIHLAKLDLTYIRNPERNKIMFLPFHLLKTYVRNRSLFFISFFALPPTGTR
jgi:hypothetical protein